MALGLGVAGTAVAVAVSDGVRVGVFVGVPMGETAAPDVDVATGVFVGAGDVFVAVDAMVGDGVPSGLSNADCVRVTLGVMVFTG